MITNKSNLIENFDNGETYVYVELTGLSTDTKPTTYGGKKIWNGSTFFEMNTSKAYMFNQSTNAWVEL